MSGIIVNPLRLGNSGAAIMAAPMSHNTIVFNSNIFDNLRLLLPISGVIVNPLTLGTSGAGDLWSWVSVPM